MTDEQIERFAERMTDALDREYLTTALTTEEYRRQLAAIDRWARIARAEARRVPA